jgi:hypothetical protein
MVWTLHPSTVAALAVALAACLAAALASWRDLSPPVVVLGAVALLWGPPVPPWGALAWSVAAAALIVAGRRSRPRTHRLLVAAGLGVWMHATVSVADAWGVPPATWRASATGVGAALAVWMLAWAAWRPEPPPEVRWVGRVPVQGSGPDA